MESVFATLRLLFALPSVLWEVWVVFPGKVYSATDSGLYSRGRFIVPQTLVCIPGEGL